MPDMAYYSILAAAGLIGLVVVAWAGLRAWSGWLALRHAELGRRYDAATPPSPAARIEMADLRERVRRLEAIAAGVDP